MRLFEIVPVHLLVLCSCAYCVRMLSVCTSVVYGKKRPLLFMHADIIYLS